MSILIWLEKWYASQCEGYWEHYYGINIETLDNPGWNVEIDLKDSIYLDIELAWKFIKNSDNDWYGYKVENSKYSASGDPFILFF